MHQVELRRQAYKDLESIPKDYARLIAQHIDSLEKDPRPNDSKKLKGDAGYSLRIGHIACYTMLMTRPNQ
jgi:mRNA-degrading endonuclease RelE of RelBE toxin-antitoxin system